MKVNFNFNVGDKVILPMILGDNKEHTIHGGIISCIYDGSVLYKVIIDNCQEDLKEFMLPDILYIDNNMAFVKWY